jgi:hypothetical protein
MMFIRKIKCQALDSIYLLLLLPISATNAFSEPISSKWDTDSLFTDIGGVHIHAYSAEDAWREITTQYLLRVNLYMDDPAVPDQRTFVFDKDQATGKEIVDAFVATYKTYTYKQNPDTGIIWLHPKRVKYADILSQRISITSHGNNAVPMYTYVYLPLCNMLRPTILDSSEVPGPVDMLLDSNGKPPFPYTWLYDVELPVGVYTAREILDFCCVADPTKAFQVRPVQWRQNSLVISRENLLSGDPLSPPRKQAVRFWGVVIGKSTNGIPSLDEIRKAMSNSDPGKRLAASLYVEACFMNYAPISLIGKAADSDQAIWTALGEEYAEWREADTNYFTELIPRIPRLAKDLQNIRDPRLALLASLQLTRENRDTSYLDSIVEKHVYTEAEIASIKPELTRMARSSKAVRDKLMEMKSQVPELSPAALRELADTNSILVLP